MELLTKKRETCLVLIMAAVFPITIALAGTDTAQINNKPPVIEAVTLYPDNAPGVSGVQINPTAGSTTTVSVTIQAKDNNGYNHISTVTVMVYKPDGSSSLRPVMAHIEEGKLVLVNIPQ
jgi:hypothetical protein